MSMTRPTRSQCSLLRALLASAVALAGTGCALMRKDVDPLPRLPEGRIRLADGLKLATDGWPEAQWWKRYQDPQLDALVTRAIQDAPLMAVARSRVDASHGYTALVESNTGPYLGLTGSVDRTQVSEHGYLGPFYHNMPAQGFTGPYYIGGTVGVQAVYEVDLWGKDKAKVEAALGLENARLAEAAQAERVLSSRVAQLYFAMQTLNATLELLEQQRTIDDELLRAHAARATRGLEPRTAAELARARKLELEQVINDARGRLAMLREALRALVGAGPDDLPAIRPAALPPLAGQLPTSLGYELLARRPDLQAMRCYVQASLSQVDAAKAAFYPSFDIKGFFGYDSLHTNNLLQRTSRQMNLIPGLSLPLFDSGRLNAALAHTRSQSNTLIAQYNQAVVDSVREVAQAGLELDVLNRQSEVQGAKLAALRFTRDGLQAQYGRGLADRVAALEANLPVLAQQARQVQIQQQQIHAEIGLTLALGGGYQAGGSGAHEGKPRP
jgi:multidrug efflux system outer membrane protein